LAAIFGGFVLVTTCPAKQSFPLVVPDSGRSIGGIFIDAEVHLTLVEKGSTLVIGHRDPILPLQAVQQLYYTNGKSIRCMTAFAELKDLVAICAFAVSADSAYSASKRLTQMTTGLLYTT
jgi:hypothetical protein